MLSHIAKMNETSMLQLCTRCRADGILARLPPLRGVPDATQEALRWPA
jgi:hypothetical protein